MAEIETPLAESEHVAVRTFVSNKTLMVRSSNFETRPLKERRVLWKPFLASLLLFFGWNISHAQTTLSAGDVAIITMNGDGNDGFTFLLLEDIATSTEIHFTDKGWDTVTNAFSLASEGTITWKPTTSMSKGATISLDSVSVGTLTASVGSASKIGIFNLSSSGDQILVYQGTTSSPTFLYAFNTRWSGGGYAGHSVGISSVNTHLPPGLTRYSTAWTVRASSGAGGHMDNWQYKCSAGATGVKDTILKRLNTMSNWNASNTTVNYTDPDCTWSISSGKTASPKRSATDSVIITGTNSSARDWGRGFEFKPKEPLLITDIGVRAYAVDTFPMVIWDVANQKQLAKMTIKPSQAGVYEYFKLSPPVFISPEKNYAITQYGDQSGYYFSTSSQINSFLEYKGMRYCGGCSKTQTFPTSTLNGYHYGTPDFLFLRSSMLVSGNDKVISHDATSTDTLNNTSFDSVFTKTYLEKDFYAFNVVRWYEDTVTLDGNPKVTISGANASDFSVVQQITVDTLFSGDSSLFRIRFTPSDTNYRKATVNIAYTDSFRGSLNYTFKISGIGVAPDYGVSFNVDSLVSCNGLKDGKITATVNGGVRPLSFLWSNNSTDSFISGVGAGTYSFRVIDANKDTVIDSIVITEPVKLTVASIVDKNVTCFAANDGGASGAAAGGTTPYTYSWSNAATTSSITGLSGGKYTLTITDNNGCLDTTSVNVFEPSALLVSSVVDKNISCNSMADGAISSQVSGGTRPYAYLWSNGSTASSLSSLSAGTYTVTVSDAKGCTTTDQETITEPAILSVATAVDSNANCNGSADGGITATSSGGTTPYTYLWSNAATAASATSLSAGTYTVTLTDANGCTATSSKSVTEPTLLVAGSITGDDIVCAGVAPNKATQVSAASGGTGSISYQWQLSSDNTNWSDISGATTSEYQPAGRAGNTWYRRVATDANGCGPVMTNSIKITINGQPIATFTSTAGCEGKQTIFTNKTTVTSGNVSTYNWSFGDQGTSNQQNPINIYKSSGNYTVSLVVTSDSGCVDSTSSTISVNPVPSVDFSATTECEGTATDFTNKSNINSGTNTYTWDLGDNNSSTTTTPSHTYTNSGYYTVQLTATSNNGCVDSVSKTVQVKQVAKPNFSATSECEGETTNFTNLSTNASTYSWDLGDNGNGSKQANPKNKYKNSGSYTVVLTATSADGCSDTAQRTVSVYGLPTAGFSGTEVCQGQSTVFTNTSTGASKYQWIFDNGTSSTNTAPSLVYGQAGNYKVELTATTANGCVDVTSNTITVNALPSVSFTTADICQSDALATTTTTTGANQYAWSFGDGNTSSQTSPIHNYSTHGQYQVKLVSTTSKGCVDSSSTTINAWAEPRVAFNASNVCLGHPMTFNNTSSIATGSMTYNWSLGDGSSTGNASPVKTYGSFGPYAVQLVATSNRGCKDSISSTVTVYNAPTVDFEAPNVCFADTLKTVNKSIISSSYTWNLGDGNTSTAQDTVNLYSKAGDYTIQLVGTTVEGCSDSISKQVTIYAKPIAGFDAEDECDQTLISFANTSYNANITSHNWSYGDGNTSKVINPNHTYNANGSYTAQLITISDNGCSDTLSKTITVHPNPVVNFSNTTECDYDSTRFTNNSSIATGSNTYQWSLGTGASSTDTNPVYHYPQASSYVVSLVATSDKGCVGNSQSIVVVNPSPLANLRAANHCEGLATQMASLSSVSTGNIAEYGWDLGDGNNSTDANPTHLYAVDGDYTVELVVKTDQSCYDTTTTVVTVWSKPEANFTTPNVCFGAVSNFTDATTDGQDYLYDFGDKWGISTLATPEYTYEAPGTYNPILYVTSSNGCKDTVTKTVTIYGLPEARFTVNNHCFGEDFQPQDQSQGTVDTWTWEYEDGNTSADQNPTHQYGKDGRYNVKLQVEDNNGCTDSLRKTVVVWPLPVVGVRTDTLVSKGYTVPMLATGGVEYKWSPVDNLDKPLKANPTATVIEDVTYTVTVANEFGCTRDTFVNLKVREDYTLEPSNIMTPDGNGQNDAWIVEKAQYYNDVEVLVFDRWGRIVYQSNNYNNSWEGTGTNGEQLPDGAYYYVVKVPAERDEYKGSITIFR